MELIAGVDLHTRMFCFVRPGPWLVLKEGRAPLFIERGGREVGGDEEEEAHEVALVRGLGTLRGRGGACVCCNGSAGRRRPQAHCHGDPHGDRR